MTAPYPSPDDVLRVSEVFFSIQGESSRIGLPSVFVRLTGCPLRCAWCDTAYAFQGGALRTVGEVVAQVAAFPARHVCVTGGEPLAQRNCLSLLSSLCDAGYDVSLETSGALDVAPVDKRVAVVMDLKAPGSGEEAKNRWDNLTHLKPGDEIKLVLAGEADYVWARGVLADHQFAARVAVLMSPVQGSLDPAELAQWILRDGLAVRLQVQLHKILWGN
ncbi:MAG: 7-carboxy-7-deazaguanine synthase QueE, partial [Rhodocyclaceae bacterium]